ncbi:MAG TPA: gamma-glutamyl-gamma-aminobutyrate hydrolase family protein [Acidimicrobiales bacterium]
MQLARIGITSTPAIHEDRRIESVNTVFVDAIADAGGLPVLLPVLDPQVADAALDGIDGLLLSGGGDIDPAFYGAEPVPEVYDVDPRRDAWELALVDAALRRRIPVLGVCRGHQVLNVARGGRMIQHVPLLTEVDHQERERFGELIHGVRVDPDSLVASVLGTDELGVNTLHHQAVAEPGEGLRVVALSDDGLIEAVESADRRVIGVQWHPELLQHRPEDRRLMRWLVEEGQLHRLAEHPTSSGALGSALA